MKTKSLLHHVYLFIFLIICVVLSQQSFGQPDHFSNLKLWFDGSDINGNGTNPVSGEAVNFWADKSGYGIDATNAGKTGGIYVSDALNGCGGVYFGNSDDNWLRTDASAELDFVEATIFMVTNDMSSTSHFSVSEIGLRNNEYNFFDKTMAHHFDIAGYTIWPAFTIPDDQFYVQAGFWGQEFRDLKLYVNGIETLGGTWLFGEPREPAFTAVSRAAFFGQRAEYYNEDFDGIICEIIVFEGKITQEQHDSIGCYLTEKYGIETAYEPASEPVSTGTAFTYQAFLRNKGGGPVNQAMDFCFTLYDGPDVNADNPIGSPLCISNVPVAAGHFNLSLDFGPGIFTGEPRWLETSVRKSGTSDSYDPQSPLLELTFSPYAIYATTAGSVPGGIVGMGTVGSIPVFTDPNTLSDSIVHQDSGNIGIGTSTPGEKLSVDGVVESQNGGFKFPDGSIQATASGVGEGIPQGGIIMWSGSVASIPQGWALCDGMNGTPDLTDRFIKSIPNASTDPGMTGGSNTHTHGMTGVTVDHSHTISTHIGSSVYRGNAHYLGVTRDHGGEFGDDYEKNRYGVPTETLSTSSTVAQIEGETGASSNLPLYYEIAFIMKK